MTNVGDIYWLLWEMIEVGVTVERQLTAAETILRRKGRSEVQKKKLDAVAGKDVVEEGKIGIEVGRTVLIDVGLTWSVAPEDGEITVADVEAIEGRKIESPSEGNFPRRATEA